MGGGAHLRLDDALAPPGARLREARGRLQSHDPRQHGRLDAPTRRLPMTIVKRELRARHLEI